MAIVAQRGTSLLSRSFREEKQLRVYRGIAWGEKYSTVRASENLDARNEFSWSSFELLPPAIRLITYLFCIAVSIVFPPDLSEHPWQPGRQTDVRFGLEVVISCTSDQ